MNERTFRAHDAHKLEDPERLVWLPPGEIIGRLPLKPGMTVADIGAGTGYFTFPLAKAVGEKGRVFAVDLQEEMLSLIRNKFPDHPGLTQITLVPGEASNSGLTEKSCDILFMANIWHELDDFPGVLRESARILRPGGTLAVIDWRADVAPPPGPPAEHRIAAMEVENTLRRNAWSASGSSNVAKYSHMILATKN